MADSPLKNCEGVVSLSVKADGEMVADTALVVSVTIRRGVQTVPSARIVLLDGDMPGATFPLSDAATFKPGTQIVITAGYGGDEAQVFAGLVVKHRLLVTGQNDARLIVDCKDASVKMTVGRRNANFIDRTDSDVMSDLARTYGIDATVDDTAVTHGALVQHFSSDWDFLLTRADATGLLVIATDGVLSIKAPKADAAPALTVTYGEDLIEFDGDLDARYQYGSAQAFAWDMKTQAVLDGVSADPAALPAQGDLDSASLAEVIGLQDLRMQSGAPQDKDTLTQWAKAQQLKSGLARLRGRMRFQGSAKAVVGGVIEIKGVGTRFSGHALVTGLVHEISDGAWITDAEFGLAPDWFSARADVHAPAAAGLLPPIPGLQVGVVLKLDGDPAGEQRIQVKVPVLQAETEGIWARLLQLHASSGFGAFFLPEVGDEVVLGYFAGDPSHPVVLGSLYSSQRAPAYALAAENNTKAMVTRCQHRLEFNEEDKTITVTTPGKNRIVLSDKDKSILLQDQNQNKVELNPSGITLDSPKDITVNAKGRIDITAVGAIGITSKVDVKAAGLNVACEAQVGFTAKGNASAELSAAGQTTVRGAMVMIN